MEKRSAHRDGGMDSSLNEGSSYPIQGARKTHPAPCDGNDKLRNIAALRSWAQKNTGGRHLSGRSRAGLQLRKPEKYPPPGQVFKSTVQGLLPLGYAFSSAACAAARRAMGTRKGEQLT